MFCVFVSRACRARGKRERACDKLPSLPEYIKTYYSDLVIPFRLTPVEACAKDLYENIT